MMAACDPWFESEIIAIMQSDAINTGRMATRNLSLFSLQIATGGRVSELLNLNRGDVLAADGSVMRTITFTGTKNKHPRTVPMVNPLPLPFLTAWIREQESLGMVSRRCPVYSTTTGKRLSRFAWYKTIKAATEECGLRGHYGTHSARKTWARDTILYYQEKAKTEEGIEPIVMLQKAGGWRSLESVRRYLAFMRDDTSDSFAALYSGVIEAMAQNRKTGKLPNNEA